MDTSIFKTFQRDVSEAQDRNDTYDMLFAGQELLEWAIGEGVMNDETVRGLKAKIEAVEESHLDRGLTEAAVTQRRVIYAQLVSQAVRVLTPVQFVEFCKVLSQG